MLKTWNISIYITWSFSRLDYVCTISDGFWLTNLTTFSGSCCSRRCNNNNCGVLEEDRRETEQAKMQFCHFIWSHFPTQAAFLATWEKEKEIWFCEKNFSILTFFSFFLAGCSSRSYQIVQLFFVSLFFSVCDNNKVNLGNIKNEEMPSKRKGDRRRKTMENLKSIDCLSTTEVLWETWPISTITIIIISSSCRPKSVLLCTECPWIEGEKKSFFYTFRSGRWIEFQHTFFLSFHRVEDSASLNWKKAVNSRRDSSGRKLWELQFFLLQRRKSQRLNFLSLTRNLQSESDINACIKPS